MNNKKYEFLVLLIPGLLGLAQILFNKQWAVLLNIWMNIFIKDFDKDLLISRSVFIFSGVVCIAITFYNLSVIE